MKQLVCSWNSGSQTFLEKQTKFPIQHNKKKLLANSLCLYHDHMHGGSSNNDDNENGGVDDDDYLNGGSASRASSASGHNLTFFRSQSARDTTRRMSSRCRFAKYKSLSSSHALKWEYTDITYLYNYILLSHMGKAYWNSTERNLAENSKKKRVTYYTRNMPKLLC